MAENAKGIVRIVLSGSTSSHSEHDTDTELEMKTKKSSNRLRRSNSENRSGLSWFGSHEALYLPIYDIIYSRNVLHDVHVCFQYCAFLRVCFSTRVPLLERSII